MNSVWTLEFAPEARKRLKKLDRAVAARIVDYLERNLTEHDDPRDFGDGLTGGWTGFWRYRVGDYRVIVKIEGETVTVFVIEVGHRREIYR